jgi:hypothetical protein
MYVGDPLCGSAPDRNLNPSPAEHFVAEWHRFTRPFDGFVASALRPPARLPRMRLISNAIEVDHRITWSDKADLRRRREPTMNTYTPATPRALLGGTAACMTALTFALFIGVPAWLCAPCESGMTVASAGPAVSAPVEVEIVPSRIDVVGVREREAPAAIAVTSAKRRVRG